MPIFAIPRYLTAGFEHQIPRYLTTKNKNQEIVYEAGVIVLSAPVARWLAYVG
jgi:hypothetical protein